MREETDKEKIEIENELLHWSRFHMLTKAEQKRLQKRGAVQVGASFQKEYGCFQYVTWMILIAILADAFYSVITGGNWITPLIYLVGLIVLAAITYIFASLV